MPEADSGSLARFLPDLWAYLRAPKVFLAAKNFRTTGSTIEAGKYLFAGVAGSLAFSVVNMNLSARSVDDASRKLFEGTLLTNTIVANCLLIALAVHLFAKRLGGVGTLRETFASFCLTNGFTWPIMTVGLFGISWILKILTGVRWTPLPPFDVPIDGVVERTTAGIWSVALGCTLLLWLAGYLMYCYSCALQSAHRLKSAVRVWLVLGAAVGLNTAFESAIVKVTLAFTTALNPLIEWVAKLYT